MPIPLDVVAVVGSTSQPSRTRALVDALLSALEERLLLRVRVIQLGEFARPLGQALARDELPAEIEKQLQAIESSTLLIVATPVYRGSYPGHFKHLFDLIGQDALVEKPVLLVATGGTDRHALVLDHQLRPLFAFFQSLTLPIGVYGANADFENYQVTSPALQARIALAADRAAPLFIENQRPLLRRAA
ncbi:FMN reductase [Ottowia thiooxydans]|uniref:FMN reductase n=1 Tax=Ottowia thiooxydans TaxID=219182 RepID=UPI000403A56D|nr:FMN reductase [Ottowia thiooxydans]